MKTILFISWITTGGWFSHATLDIKNVDFDSKEKCEEVAQVYNDEAKTKLLPLEIILHAECVEQQHV